jgi:hypothetical protein
MNNSHLLGLSLFGTCVFFALLFLIKNGQKPHGYATGLTRRGTLIGVLSFIGLGVVAGWGAFYIDNQMRITTLHEELVEGSLGQKLNRAAPLRRVTFKVEHPQVEHTLALWPESDGIPDFAATVHFRLEDAKQQTILEKEIRFEPELGNGRNATMEWDSQSFSFTPQRAETYTLYITPITVDIPRVHVYITDPQKRNGVRIPGY